MSKALPNFIIAGAPKAGTSSVHNWIADHPLSIGSTEKETYFFVDPGTHMYRKHANTAQGLDAYKKYFPVDYSADPTIVFESTPSYLYYDRALNGIAKLPTRPKCLFIVREPAEQIYSLFRYFKNNWNWIPANETFANYITSVRERKANYKGNELAENAIKYACYVDYLIRWRDKLGADRMLLTTFDELKKDEKGLIQRVASWLGLDPLFYETYAFPRDNETYAAKNINLQRVNIAIRSKLPQGRLYKRLRLAYRWFNTRKPFGPSDEEKRCINELKEEFNPNTSLK
jgi:hypothetical protein